MSVEQESKEILYPKKYEALVDYALASLNEIDDDLIKKLQILHPVCNTLLSIVCRSCVQWDKNTDDVNPSLCPHSCKMKKIMYHRIAEFGDDWLR